LGGFDCGFKTDVIRDLVLENTQEIVLQDHIDCVADESHRDILGSDSLRSFFSFRNTDLNHLSGVGEKEFRLYPGPENATERRVSLVPNERK